MNEVSRDNRLVLTKAAMTVLDSWKLDSDQMRIVLGLPESCRARSFQKFRSHEPFPESAAVDRRVDYLLKIAGALRTSYPTNPSMGGRWLRQKHRRLGRPPLSLLLEGGEEGLVAVLAELDCTFSWDLSGSTSH